VYCQHSDIMACAAAYVVECEKLGTLLGLQLCRECKKHWRFGGLTAFSSGSFLGSVLHIQILQRIWAAVQTSASTKQPTGQKKVQGRNEINALTKDFLPSYDKLLVALCPILESIPPAPHQSSPPRHGFSSDRWTVHPTLHGNRSFIALSIILSEAI